jgi:uncharacterized RDD family membrane protein YckC
MSIVLLLSIFLFPIGVIFGLIYMAVCDYLQSGQSVGKKLMGFRVISTEDGGPCTVKQSIIRNLPIMAPLSLALIPFWGWILSIIIGAPLLLLEAYLLSSLDSGYRLGDVMADTTVMGDDNKMSLKKKSTWFNNGIVKT